MSGIRLPLHFCPKKYFTSLLHYEAQQPDWVALAVDEISFCVFIVLIFIILSDCHLGPQIC